MWFNGVRRPDVTGREFPETVLADIPSFPTQLTRNSERHAAPGVGAPLHSPAPALTHRHFDTQTSTWPPSTTITWPVL